ncbi:potassium channel family protein [Chloroflexota bacterium]
MKRTLKRFKLLFVLPLAVLLVGTFGFMILENLSFTDALYFTIVTISTVGYGDIHPTGTAGKLFNIVLIILGIGTFFTLVTGATQAIIQRGHDRLRRKKLNMIIGVFFTEVGNHLLHTLTQYDPGVDEIRQDISLHQDFSPAEFAHLKKRLQQHEHAIDQKLVQLPDLFSFLQEKGDLLLRQMENPDLIEHEAFTGLLWAVVHLRDELISRESLLDLPATDLEHLANDARRAYVALSKQWVNHMQHLKGNYPYLFSLALRTNPFSQKPSAIVE